MEMRLIVLNGNSFRAHAVQRCRCSSPRPVWKGRSGEEAMVVVREQWYPGGDGSSQWECCWHS